MDWNPTLPGTKKVILYPLCKYVSSQGCFWAKWVQDQFFQLPGRPCFGVVNENSQCYLLHTNHFFQFTASSCGICVPREALFHYFHKGGIFDGGGCFIIISCLLDSCTAQMIVFFSADNCHLRSLQDNKENIYSGVFFFLMKDMGQNHSRVSFF